MPKLPKIEKRQRVGRVNSEQRAHHVAAALAHAGAGKNTPYYLGQAVRQWFDEDPSAKAAFVKWYEAQP